MFWLGCLINYFNKQDPDEFHSMGIIKKILGFYCKIAPFWLKITNYVKFIIAIVLAYYVLGTKIGTSYLTSTTTVATLDQRCVNNLYLPELMAKYDNFKVIFFGIEIAVNFITICVYGTLRGWIDQDAYLYEPENRRRHVLYRLLFRTLGP